MVPSGFDDVGVRQPRTCRGDPDAGEAVVQEREIVEHVLARLVAVHVHAKAGGPRRRTPPSVAGWRSWCPFAGRAGADGAAPPRAGRAGWGRVVLARLRFGPQPCGFPSRRRSGGGWRPPPRPHRASGGRNRAPGRGGRRSAGGLCPGRRGRQAWPQAPRSSRRAQACRWRAEISTRCSCW